MLFSNYGPLSYRLLCQGQDLPIKRSLTPTSLHRRVSDKKSSGNGKRRVTLVWEHRLRGSNLFKSCLQCLLYHFCYDLFGFIPESRLTHSVTPCSPRFSVIRPWGKLFSGTFRHLPHLVAWCPTLEATDRKFSFITSEPSHWHSFSLNLRVCKSLHMWITRDAADDWTGQMSRPLRIERWTRVVPIHALYIQLSTNLHIYDHAKIRKWCLSSICGHGTMNQCRKLPL